MKIGISTMPMKNDLVRTAETYSRQAMMSDLDTTSIVDAGLSKVECADGDPWSQIDEPKPGIDKSTTNNHPPNSRIAHRRFPCEPARHSNRATTIARR